MDSRRIDEMVWRALTDVPFREGLLNGHRRELVTAMDLTDAEQMAVLSVQADSLEGFAEALYNYAPSRRQQSRLAPVPPALGQSHIPSHGLAARAMI